jgi:hypothetical protein
VPAHAELSQIFPFFRGMSSLVMSSKNPREANGPPGAACGVSDGASIEAVDVPWGQRSGLGAASRHLAWILIALAAFSGFAYVYAFGVNVFWWDDWTALPLLYEQYAEGTLTASSLWTQQNEHRIVLPKLVMLGLGVLTRGNALPLMYFTEVLLSAILVTFLVSFRRQFGGGQAIWLMAPVAFLVFSLRQTENMLWAIQSAFVMIVAAAFAAFCV